MAPITRAASTVFAVLSLLGCGRQEATRPKLATPASGAVVPASSPGPTPDPPINCPSCDEWNAPRAPFRVFANTYFVGTQGLSSVLIVTPAGLVLIDVALPQSVPVIATNIEALGFSARDIRYILTSHAHYDHVGGVSAMQRFANATVLTSASTAAALALGHPVPTDPQFGTGPSDAFPKVTTGVQVMRDGETIVVGGTTITARYTPGHTPGATTWTWRSCEGDRCLDLVYVDSLTAVSKDGFEYSDEPSLVETFRASLRTVSSLPCDIVISTHPSATGMDEKVTGRAKAAVAAGAAGDPLIDPGACRALAERSTRALDERLAAEARTP